MLGSVFRFETCTALILSQSAFSSLKPCFDESSTRLFSPTGFCVLKEPPMSEEKKIITVVIVDDEESIRTLVQATLEGPECRVLLAANGHEALALAHSARPQAIVLDWMMPSMSGLEFLRRLNADPDVSHIPVVMLTAMGQEKDRQAALDAGAKAFLMKPFSPLQLVGIVHETVNPSTGEHPAQGANGRAARA